MQLVSYPRSFFCVTQHAPAELTPRAQERLRLLKAWERLMAGGMTAAAGARVLSVSRASLYRWQKRLQREGLGGPEDRSRRPRRVGKAEWSEALAEAVRRLREKYPRWGKETLAVLLKRDGHQTSASTVGRILGRLRARGLLIEPPRGSVTVRKRRVRRPYPRTEHREHAVRRAGDLVQAVRPGGLRPPTRSAVGWSGTVGPMRRSCTSSTKGSLTWPASIEPFATGRQCTTRSGRTDLWTRRHWQSIFGGTTLGWPGN